MNVFFSMMEAKWFAAYFSEIDTKTENRSSDFFSKNLNQLQMAPGKGLMKGFIDMVFRSNDQYFLVDWKSNFLGNQLANYKQTILTKVMLSALALRWIAVRTVPLLLKRIV